MRNACQLPNGGAAPATPRFNAVAPEWLVTNGAADAAPAVPAAESTLGSHPCVALSSAQVFPEWINRNLAGHALQQTAITPLTSCLTPGVHFRQRNLWYKSKPVKVNWPANFRRNSLD